MAEELDTKPFAEHLETEERVLYTGRANTGSVLRASLWMLSPILDIFMGKKDPLKQWRVAVTNRRFLLILHDGKEQQSYPYEQLTNIELKRAGGVNRVLTLRSGGSDEVELGLPMARNDYAELEQALREAAPTLMGG